MSSKLRALIEGDAPKSDQDEVNQLLTEENPPKQEEVKTTETIDKVEPVKEEGDITDEVFNFDEPDKKEESKVEPDDDSLDDKDKWRSRLSAEGKARKEAESKLAALESEIEQYREKTGDYEKKLKYFTSKVASPDVTPEYQELKEKVYAPLNEFDDLIQMERHDAPSIAKEMPQIIEQLETLGDNKALVAQFTKSLAVSLASSYVQWDDYKDESGVVDMQSVISDLSEDEKLLYRDALSGLKRLIPQFKKGKVELDALSQEITSNNDKYQHKSQLSKFKETSESLTEKYKAIKVLTDEEIEADPHSFTSFVSQGIRDEKNTKRFEEAIKAVVSLDTGAPILTDRQREIYESQGEDPEEKQKLLNKRHEKTAEMVKSEMVYFLTNKTRIMEAVQFMLKHKDEIADKDHDESSIFEASTLGTRSASKPQVKNKLTKLEQLTGARSMFNKD